MADRPLDGKVALVAGATRGAGRGIARMLGAVRAHVEQAVMIHVITARHAAPLMLRKRGGLIVEVSDGHDDGFTDIDGRRPAFFPMLERVTAALAGRGGDLDPTERFLLLTRYRQVHREPAQAGAARRLAAKLALGDLGPGLGTRDDPAGIPKGA